MLLFNTLHCFLLAGICICVDGTPVPLPDVKSEQDHDCYGQCIGSLETTDVRSESSGGKHVTSLFWKVGAGGGAGPHGRPEGTALVTQTEKGNSLDGRSGLSEAGGEVWRRRSLVKKVGIRETGDARRQSTSVLPVYPDIPITSEAVVISTGGRSQIDVSTMRFPPGGFLASFTALPQMNIAAKDSRDQSEEEQSKPFPYADSVRDKEPSFGDQEWSQKPTPHSPIPPLVFVSPQTSTSPWGHDGATISFLPDPLLPEIGSNLMPREDGPENLWTEAMRPSGVGTVVPLSQDEATEGTMSSEALPLIFEPLEDATSERAPPDSEAAVTSAADVPQRPATIDLEMLDTVETDSDSRGLPPLKQDWMSPWQTSGTEQLEPVRYSGPSVSPRRAGTVVDPHSDRGAVRMQELEENLPTNDPLQHALITKTSTHQPVHKSRSGLEEMESDEEPDEDEENSEESLEDESEEDLTEMPKTSSTQPPYSLIPPPPVWLQRNQGLMRSWLELIREKAGYVSGMLAPVGIGITGALLIVGALYSIRMIHRKRRNSFKHQRMKVRQPEQLGESGTSRQDQAMLLADSSEDEF